MRNDLTPRQLQLLAFWLALVMSLAGLGSHSLWTPDEPRDASVGLAMARTGDWAVPRLNGEPFLEKPPLYWWFQAAAFRLFGAGDGIARLPSALFGVLTLGVAFLMGARLGGPRVGLLAVAVLSTLTEFSETMHRAVVDPALIFFVAAAHLGFLLLHLPRSGRERWWGAALIAAAVPLAFLAKGVAGPLLAVGPPLTYLLVTRQFGAIGRAWPAVALGAPLFALGVLPWVAALHRAEGMEAVRVCLVGNTLGRFAGRSGDAFGFGHNQPPWYYLLNAPASLLPWVLAIPAMLRSGVMRRGADDGGRRTLFAIAALGLALLSIPTGKRTLYLVPLLPALAAATAGWLDGCRAGERWDRRTLLVMTGVAAVLLAFCSAVFLGLGLGLPIAGRFSSTLSAGLRPFPAVAGGLLLLGGAAWLAVAAASRARRGTVPGPALATLPWIAFFLLLQGPMKSVGDPIKTLHPFTAALARSLGPDEEVLFFRPTETDLGIVNYDLDRRVRAVNDPEDLRQALRSNLAAHVAFQRKEGQRLPADLRARLVPVYEEEALRASPRVIARWTPDPGREAALGGAVPDFLP